MEGIQRLVDRVNSHLRMIEQLHSRALTAVSPEESFRKYSFFSIKKEKNKQKIVKKNC